jgi:hypothetical protein
MAITFSRRTLLGGTAAVAVLSGGGLAALHSFTVTDLIRVTLHRLVGKFTMPEAEFEAFATDFANTSWELDRVKSRILRAAEMTGLKTVTADAVMAGDIEQFERKLLTSFVMSTNYLELEHPESEPVSYLGVMNACANPFAKFDQIDS